VTTYPFVFNPHDVPPMNVDTPPPPSKTRDYFPIGEFLAKAAKVESFGSFSNGLDDSVPCKFSFFTVSGTFVYLFHSESRPPMSWLIFADMTSCVAKKQIPTKLATSFIRYLSQNQIELSWKNTDADSVYRARLRSLESSNSIKTVAIAPRVQPISREAVRSKTDLNFFARRSISSSPLSGVYMKSIVPAARQSALKQATAKKPTAKKVAAKKPVAKKAAAKKR
jgi:hypothetical protein